MTHKILVGGAWREVPKPPSVFHPVNPATGQSLEDAYPVSAWSDIEKALDAAPEAVEGLRTAGPERTARFLEAFAAQMEGRSEDLMVLACLETGLPVEPRLKSVEFPRMAGQLRLAAEACRDRSWCRATIDTKLDIRSMFGPLGGPVAVFGPNNFPFAFNAVGGGDFAAAVAAGNPVIAKANPGHPGTTRLFAEGALEALLETGLPPSALQLLYHFAPEDGLRLVSDPRLGATAFTGSRAAGLRLKDAADRAGRPIYLEMSSTNPVFILPGALEERGEAIAAELAGSCLLGAGQFCTKPGLIVLPAVPAGGAFIDAVAAAFGKSEPGVLLGRSVLEGLREAVVRLPKAGAALVAGGTGPEGPGYRFSPTLFRASGESFLLHPGALQVESFGSLSVAVVARDVTQMAAIARRLDGQLTATIYSALDGRDDGSYALIEPLLRRRAGRLLNDRMPTGVAVSPAMNHGGPFPAAGHPGFTSVGLPASMLRFAALYCYDHVRQDRLPAELRDPNPTGGMQRLIDGEWTRRSL
jgi:alpha-ketoglutaric semialdehyde dehydrogenase